MAYITEVLYIYIFINIHTHRFLICVYCCYVPSYTRLTTGVSLAMGWNPWCWNLAAAISCLEFLGGPTTESCGHCCWTGRFHHRFVALTFCPSWPTFLRGRVKIDAFCDLRGGTHNCPSKIHCSFFSNSQKETQEMLRICWSLGPFENGFKGAYMNAFWPSGLCHIIWTLWSSKASQKLKLSRPWPHPHGKLFHVISLLRRCDMLQVIYRSHLMIL